MDTVLVACGITLGLLVTGIILKASRRETRVVSAVLISVGGIGLLVVVVTGLIPRLFY